MMRISKGLRANTRRFRPLINIARKLTKLSYFKRRAHQKRIIINIDASKLPPRTLRFMYWRRMMGEGFTSFVTSSSLTGEKKRLEGNKSRKRVKKKGRSNQK